MHIKNIIEVSKRLRAAQPTIAELSVSLSRARISLGGTVAPGAIWGGKESRELFTPNATGTITPRDDHYGAYTDKPQWAKEPPTVPGWYWFRRSSGFKSVVLVSKPWNDVIVQMAGCNELIAMEAADKSCEWCGPLTPPE